MLRSHYSYPDLASLRQQMNQLYRNGSDRNERSDRDTPWTPPIELENFSDRLTLRVLLPGVNPQDVDIGVTRETVTIQGQRPYRQKADSRGFFQAEFPYGEFARRINLPIPVSREDIQADFSHGILTLTLHKWEARENRPIKVNLSDRENRDRAKIQPNAIADPWAE